MLFPVHLEREKCSMSDLLQARNLLEAARRDLTALTGMLKPDLFTDEIFGFHVQQAIEKSLKAWIAALGEIYPYTHDLGLLLRKLEDLGCDVSSYMDLVAYSDFAAQIRYIGVGANEDPIQRDDVIAQVRSLYSRVNILTQPEEASD